MLPPRGASPGGRPPTIILGAARSGTKLLRRLIAASGCYAEAPFDVNYLWRFGNERHPDDALPAELATDKVQCFIRDRIRRCAKLPPGNWALVEKTVSNPLRVEFVRAVFPEANIVALIRDGRDVVESAQRRRREPPELGRLLAKARTFPWRHCAPYAWKYAAAVSRRVLGRSTYVRTWGPRYPGIDDDVRQTSLLEVCARQWTECVEHYERSRPALPPNQLLELRYEDLVRDPADAVDRLCNFLQIDLRQTVRDLAFRSVESHHIGGHRRLSERELRQATAIMAPTLSRWGYLGHAVERRSKAA